MIIISMTWYINYGIEDQTTIVTLEIFIFFIINNYCAKWNTNVCHICHQLMIVQAYVRTSDAYSASFKEFLVGGPPTLPEKEPIFKYHSRLV